MLLTPSTDSDGKPELNDNERILICCDSCSISFGELTGKGTVYITSESIVWITSSDTSTCQSFCSPLQNLMVHALSDKESASPYLFLQLENQLDDIQITHAEFDTLSNLYESLCEGQRLNPCEGSSDEETGNAMNPFMAFGDVGGFDQFDAINGQIDAVDEQKNNEAQTALSEEERMKLLQEWESKLVLDGPNGFLEPVDSSQFADVDQPDHLDQGKEKNPYLDADLVKSFDQFAPEQNAKFENKFKAKTAEVNEE